ncbi:MAG: type II secretion system F family protein [Chloroflexi bacterium]|nr:type II secretion system F family protein [Chloroflexota bacterium]
MPYRYVAYTTNGELVRGVVQAPTEEAAEETLWKSNYTVVSLKASRPRPGLTELLPSFFGVKRRQIIIFSRQVATLIESGIPILRSLRLLHGQTDGKAMKTVLGKIIEDIQSGISMSESMQKYPLIFPYIYSRMVQVGERTGNMESILRRLASYMEREEALQRKLLAAMSYPAFVMSIAIVVVYVMVTVTLPALLGLLLAFNTELPFATKALIAITNFATNYNRQILIVTAAAVLFFTFYTSTKTGAYQRDRFLLAIPLIGKINKEIIISRFANTMAVLLRAGLPMPEIMELVLQTTSNRVYAKAMEKVRLELLQGQGLSSPMSQSKLFPSLLVQMVRVGEESGTLDSNLETMGNFYEEEADRAIDTMANMVQPILMIFIGGIVGFIAMAVIVPIYSVYGSIK